MAISSNRSPSPTRIRTNPDSRTPETGVRRSFSSHPFSRSESKPSIVPARRSLDLTATPANSPSDLSRRISGSIRASYEHKENEKDQNVKPSRGRSPSVLKGSKNFMAPTISAASKFAPSPKKKILAERNETIRSSVSDSDGIASVVIDFKVAPQTQNMSSMPRVKDSEEMIDSKPRGILKSQVPSDTPNLLESEMGISDAKIVHFSSTIKPTCSSASPVLAPLDTDPYRPPYDPETNYLSPRPRFLHYKPKPRIEVCLNKVEFIVPGEGKKLEDSFASESCSDTEVTEETLSSESQKDSENASSPSEILSEEDEKPHVSEVKPDSIREQETVIQPKEEEENHVSEVKPDSIHEQDSLIQPKEASKSNLDVSWVRSRIRHFLLVLVIACLSIPVIDSPVLSPSVHKDLSFLKLDSSAKIAEFARENFNGLTSNIRFWSAKSISYLSELIANPGVVEEMVFYRLSNLTALDEEVLLDGYQRAEFSTKGREEEYEQNDLEHEKEGDGEEVSMHEEDWTEEIQIEEEVELEATEEFIEEYEELSPPEVIDNVQVFEFQDQMSTQITEAEVTPESLELTAPPQISDFGELNEKETLDDSQINTQHTDVEVTPENVESSASGLGDLIAGLPCVDTVPTDVNVASQNLEVDAPVGSPDVGELNGSLLGVESLEPEHKFPVQNLLGVFSILVVMAATAAYYHLKCRKVTTGTVANSVLPKKLISKTESISGDSDHPNQERLSRNWPTEEMVGESGPSEMSSSFKNLSYDRKESERANEVQSHERKVRYSKRESLASSSEYSASPSYGSFTTFEKLQSKHGCGDEEVVTPVRRSSRIRKQVVSP